MVSTHMPCQEEEIRRMMLRKQLKRVLQHCNSLIVLFLILIHEKVEQRFIPTI